MKVRDSILWGGSSRRDLAERFRVPEGRLATADASDQGVGGEIEHSSINIMEICYISARSHV
jgi:hypothetical protein